MGKKGTKRKTKWRALPLGEEAGGSGNEEDLLDEDQSTTSSVVGGQPTSNNIKRQQPFYKMADKPYRQTRRFAYDRFRNKEPLVKLESKTFDEEEYTKITTPRQDVLFKKGYFGRKRESSVEEAPPPTGETDGEEPMMDQIIITNGFVDERGHYLVNGNSYEIYDPYSNTVTVVVGPPPYANGVTQPVLAAVSCQPVPLQPVDWYPPGADWPSQGSAWTPSPYPRNPHQDSVNGLDAPPSFAPTPDPQMPNLYNQPAYVVPGYGYSESPVFNGVPLQMNPPTEAQNSDEHVLELKKTRRKSTESVIEEKKTEPNGEEMTPKPIENPIIAQDISNSAAAPPPPPACETQNPRTDETTVQEHTVPQQMEARHVEKQSHSTQTNPPETTPHQRVNPSGKESHSTQTPPEETFQSNKIDSKPQEKSNKTVSDTIFSPGVGKPEGETSPSWKPHGNRYGNSVKKFQEEPSRKLPQQRTNFSEGRKFNVEKSDSSPVKVSYAKKAAMSGLENGNPKIVNGTTGKVVNGGFNNSQTPVVNGISQVLTTNGTNRANNAKQVSPAKYEEKRNGFVKARYNRGKTTNDRTNQKYKERKFELKPFEEPEKKREETANESRSQSEKSSTVSELSSPTELSSGQNTPPEKLIVKKMEEDINKSFEEKLKENLTKTEEVEEEEKEKEEKKEKEKKEEKEEKEEMEEMEEMEEKQEKKEKKKEEKKKTKTEEKPKGKKKKNKVKQDSEKSKEGKGKKKKKRAQEETKEKFESDNSSEEIPFLSNIRQKDLLFGSWEGLKGEEEDFISEMGSLLNGDKEILKSLGLTNDSISYSKLPLHSDLLMMLPTFRWSRPKLKIEDFFSPAPYQSDFFTRRNITSMKSTKPEEFFASVIDGPTAEKTEKKKETKKGKSEEGSSSTKKNTPKGGKNNGGKKAVQPEEEKKPEVVEEKDGKLGIVEAVETWLQEQSESEKFISVESFENLMKQETQGEETKPKNGGSNPIHAPCRSDDNEDIADFREGGECIRVANVINDGFLHVSREFPASKNSSRRHRSSSLDAKLSEVNVKKHLKFLTDSASFCQDLISDVRNGLPAGTEFATEELCDPKQTVTKYYIIAPSGSTRHESDSENEVFDALEYKFLAKENQEGDGKSPDGNGNVSITDSGVHSDLESSEDNATEQQKETTTCKLQ